MHIAPAKLNLLLSVGDALPEGHPDTPEGKAGYHALCSWFATIALDDELVIEARSAGSCDDDASSWASIAWASDAPLRSEIDWPLDKDLCVRAARALQAHVRRPLPVKLALRKRIPVGAGLGGGSSDAATTLLALRDACKLDVTHDELAQLAMRLGSDVAYFVRVATRESEGGDDADESEGTQPAGGAIVEGLGELVEPLSAPQTELVLIVSRVQCETRAVYRAFDELRMLRRAELAGEGKKPRPYDGPRSETVRRRANEMVHMGELNERQLMNDLELAALRVQPLLGPLKTALGKATRRLVHVTGSGSAMFIVPETGKVQWTLERAAAVCESEPGVAADARALLVQTR